jgi:hypothetical protein
MWGSLSDERAGLSFSIGTVSSNKSVVNMYNCYCWPLVIGIASGRITTQKTHPLPSNGCLRTHVETPALLLQALPRNGSTLLLVAYLLRACLSSRSLAMGLHVTI